MRQFRLSGSVEGVMSNHLISTPTVFVGAPLSLNHGHAFSDHFQELAAGNLQVMGLHDRLIDFLDKHLSADFFAERRLGLLQKTTLARNRFDYSQTFQFGVSLRDRVPVDLQVLG